MGNKVKSIGKTEVKSTNVIRMDVRMDKLVGKLLNEQKMAAKKCPPPPTR